MGNTWVILHYLAVTEKLELAVARIETETTGSKGPQAWRLADCMYISVRAYMGEGDAGQRKILRKEVDMKENM